VNLEDVIGSHAGAFVGSPILGFIFSRAIEFVLTASASGSGDGGTV
jgi:hypothetical protein